MCVSPDLVRIPSQSSTVRAHRVGTLSRTFGLDLVSPLSLDASTPRDTSVSFHGNPKQRTDRSRKRRLGGGLLLCSPCMERERGRRSTPYRTPSSRQSVSEALCPVCKGRIDGTYSTPCGLHGILCVSSSLSPTRNKRRGSGLDAPSCPCTVSPSTPSCSSSGVSRSFPSLPRPYTESMVVSLSIAAADDGLDSDWDSRQLPAGRRRFFERPNGLDDGMASHDDDHLGGSSSCHTRNQSMPGSHESIRLDLGGSKHDRDTCGMEGRWSVSMVYLSMEHGCHLSRWLFLLCMSPPPD